MTVTNFTSIATDDFGTLKAGTHTLTGGEASAAGGLDIDTGLTSVTGYIVQIFRSGVNINSDQGVSESSGTITVTDGGSTYELTSGDVVNWIAWGS